MARFAIPSRGRGSGPGQNQNKLGPNSRARAIGSKIRNSRGALRSRSSDNNNDESNTNSRQRRLPSISRRGRSRSSSRPRKNNIMPGGKRKMSPSKQLIDYNNMEHSMDTDMDVDKSLCTMSVSPAARSALAGGGEGYYDNNDVEQGLMDHPFLIPSDYKLSPRSDIWLYLFLSSCTSTIALASSSPPHWRGASETLSLAAMGISTVISLFTSVAYRYGPSRDGLTNPLRGLRDRRRTSTSSSSSPSASMNSLTGEFLLSSLLLVLWLTTSGLVLQGDSYMAVADTEIWNTNLFFGTWISTSLVTYLVADLTTVDDARGMLPREYFSVMGNALSRGWLLLFVAAVALLAFSFTLRSGGACAGSLMTTNICRGAMVGVTFGVFGMIFAGGYLMICLLDHKVAPRQQQQQVASKPTRKVLLGSALACVSLISYSINAAYVTMPTLQRGISEPANIYFSSWICFALSVYICIRQLEAFAVPGSTRSPSSMFPASKSLKAMTSRGRGRRRLRRGNSRESASTAPASNFDSGDEDEQKNRVFAIEDVTQGRDDEVATMDQQSHQFTANADDALTAMVDSQSDDGPMLFLPTGGGSEPSDIDNSSYPSVSKMMYPLPNYGLSAPPPRSRSPKDFRDPEGSSEDTSKKTQLEPPATDFGLSFIGGIDAKPAISSGSSDNSYRKSNIDADGQRYDDIVPDQDQGSSQSMRGFFIGSGSLSQQSGNSYQRTNSYPTSLNQTTRPPPRPFPGQNLQTTLRQARDPSLRTPSFNTAPSNTAFHGGMSSPAGQRGLPQAMVPPPPDQAYQQMNVARPKPPPPMQPMETLDDVRTEGDSTLTSVAPTIDGNLSKGTGISSKKSKSSRSSSGTKSRSRSGSRKKRRSKSRDKKREGDKKKRSDSKHSRSSSRNKKERSMRSSKSGKSGRSSKSGRSGSTRGPLTVSNDSSGPQGGGPPTVSASGGSLQTPETVDAPPQTRMGQLGPGPHVQQQQQEQAQQQQSFHTSDGFDDNRPVSSVNGSPDAMSMVSEPTMDGFGPPEDYNTLHTRPPPPPRPDNRGSSMAISGGSNALRYSRTELTDGSSHTNDNQAMRQGAVDKMVMEALRQAQEARQHSHHDLGHISRTGGGGNSQGTAPLSMSVPAGLGPPPFTPGGSSKQSSFVARSNSSHGVPGSAILSPPPKSPQDRSKSPANKKDPLNSFNKQKSKRGSRSGSGGKGSSGHQPGAGSIHSFYSESEGASFDAGDAFAC